MGGCKNVLIALGTVLIVVMVVGQLFGGEGARSPEPTPTITKSPAYLAAVAAARELAEADGVEDDYTWELIESAKKCGFGIGEMADLVMAVGDGIEETRSDIDVPRRKTMLIVMTQKPTDRDCAMFLAGVSILVEEMP